MELADASASEGHVELPLKGKDSTVVLSDEVALARVKDVFDRWICGAIEDLSSSPGVSLAFVVIACAIDYLSGFWVGRDSKGKDYVNFLKTFPEFAARYNPEDIYKSLRCGLVHNFTIHNNAYVLTHNHPENHLKKAASGQILLNLNDFYADFKIMKEEYFSNANLNSEVKKKFLKRYRKLGFLIYTEIPMGNGA